MNKLTELLRETARVEISGAFPEALLNACAAAAIEFWDMDCLDAYTVRLSVYDQRLGELEAAAVRCMCDVKLLAKSGGRSTLRLLLRRRWLLIFALLTAAALALSSLFIWDFQIYGNNVLTKARILRALDSCGVRSGAYWPSISSDLVRSRMTALLPELAWMSVNVSGSRAVILVVERREKPEIYAQSAGADIVAEKSGIIKSMSVLSGKALASPGQAVVSGETLVSGTLENLSGGERQVRSLARISADTWYDISSIAPARVSEKTAVTRRRSLFALRLGNIRINFFIRGRKAVDGCDKIVHNYTVGVDGLFTLPVSLVREEYVYYTVREADSAEGDMMCARLCAELADGVDGTVLERTLSSSVSGGLLYASLRAHCVENIGLTRELPR